MYWPYAVKCVAEKENVLWVFLLREGVIIYRRMKFIPKNFNVLIIEI